MLLMLLFLLLQVLAGTVQGRTASDIVTLRDCIVFLNFPVSMAMTDVPTIFQTSTPIRHAADFDIEALPPTVAPTPNTFKEDYAMSVEPVMKLVDSLFSRSVWNGLPIVTHSPASDSEID